LAELGLKNTETEAHSLLDLWLNLGGNFLDTARIYSDWVPGEIGRSERILGDWLKSSGKRDKVILATKGGHPPLEDWTAQRLGADDLRHDLELSLSALRTDRIDLYWLHRDNPDRPVEDIMTTVHQLITEGKVRYVGASNWSVSRVRSANAFARKNGLSPFVATQMQWNLATRWMRPPPVHQGLTTFDIGAERLHMEEALTAIPYNSQAGGFFSKILGGSDAERSKGLNGSFGTPSNLAVADAVRAIATRRQVKINAVILGYLFHFPFPVVPVVGCWNRAQLEDSVAASVFSLPPEDWEQLRSCLGLGDAGEHE
jgi:aryl-alcohol dehydrogenase-like predicted oxidoreductase